MPRCVVVVMGCSAGGIEAVVKLSRDLPKDIPSIIFIAVHAYPLNTPAPPRILTRAGSLPAAYFKDGVEIIDRLSYIAPPATLC